MSTRAVVLVTLPNGQMRVCQWLDHDGYPSWGGVQVWRAHKGQTYPSAYYEAPVLLDDSEDRPNALNALEHSRWVYVLRESCLDVWERDPMEPYREPVCRGFVRLDAPEGEAVRTLRALAA